MYAQGTQPPSELVKQAEGAQALLEEAARFFKNPSEERAYLTHKAALKANSFYEEAQTAIRAGHGPWRENWLSISRHFMELLTETRKAVEETIRFKAAGGKDYAAMAGLLRDAGGDLIEAVNGVASGRPCEDSLIAAKKTAGEVERIYRSARFKALDAPNVVAGLKDKEIAKRLSDAAEAIQQAVDRVAELLSD